MATREEYERQSHVIVHDLSLHMEQRIDTILNDFKDRCDDMEIPSEKAAVAALAVLCKFVVLVSQLPDISANRKEFTAMCNWHFDQLKERIHG